MIIDANTVPDNQVLESDICIIGAGAAGLCIANALQNTSLQVTMLESGGFEYDQKTQSLYQGKNVGLPYFPLDSSRLRFFGGTTNHWGGYCQPLNEFDFKKHDHISHSGWPIDITDLESYYLQTMKELHLGPFEWKSEYWEEHSAKKTLKFSNPRMENRVLQIVTSDYRNFAHNYRKDLETSKNINTYLNANVTDIACNESGNSVRQVAVNTLEGKQFSVKAKNFVLAAGGIENPRIMLFSNKQHKNGLGNQYDLIGRFFAEHPRFTVGKIYPASAKVNMEFYFPHKVNGVTIKGDVSLSPTALDQAGLTDVQFKLSPVHDDAHVAALKSKGGNSLINILQSAKKGKMPAEFNKHLSRVIFDIENIPGFFYSKMNKNNLPVKYLNMVIRLDSTPNPDSRVKLSVSERDALGLPQLELDWRLNGSDKDIAFRAAKIVGESIGQEGFGRLQMTINSSDNNWPEDLAGGFHHMGTTRMSNDPKSGVVDENCKVHDLANLFIAGSSVFPTYGSGAPTLTIIALALRLADHLKNRTS